MSTMMNDRVPEGTHVEVSMTFLDPADRAPGLPSDTARLPYDGRTRGFLTAPACVGDHVRIRTFTGRVVSGVLRTVRPADTHTFGQAHPALLAAIEAIQRYGSTASPQEKERVDESSR